MATEIAKIAIFQHPGHCRLTLSRHGTPTNIRVKVEQACRGCHMFVQNFIKLSIGL